MSVATVSPTLNSGALPAQYQPFAGQIVAAAQQYGIDPTVLAGLLVHESGINAQGQAIFSPAGAGGIGQFMPLTAKAYGVNVYDNNSGILGAAHYLSDLLKSTGNYPAALASYNEGYGNYQQYGPNGPPGNIYEKPSTYAQTILSLAQSFGAASPSPSASPSPGATPDPQAGPAPSSATTSTTTTTTGDGFWIGPWHVTFPTGPGGLPLSKYIMALIAGGLLIIGGVAWLMKSEVQAHPEAEKAAEAAALL